MSYLEKHIVDQIHDLESPLNERMTFEEVMQRREKKKRRLLLFWPRIVVVGGLFTAAGLGYFVWNSSHGKINKSVVIAANQSQQTQKNTESKQAEEKAQKFIGTTTYKSTDKTVIYNNNIQAYSEKQNHAETSTEILAQTRNIIPAEIVIDYQKVTNSDILTAISVVTQNETSAINPSENKVSNSNKITLTGEAMEPAEIPGSAINKAETIAVSVPKVDIIPVSNFNNEAPTNAPVLEEITSRITATSVTAAEISSVSEVEQQAEANHWINIEALLALTHGKGLQMFEIPDPLSESDFKAVFVDLEDEELNHYFKPGNFDSPYHLELSVGTGSRVLTNFDETLPLSVLGNQYNAHYQLSVLKDLSNGIQIAVGASYGEWEGNGQWQKREWNSYTVRDSSVLIGFPNPNDRQVIYFDSTVNELTTTQGGINYQITKISLPIGFRKLMYLGKTPFRVAMQISPGRTIKSTGYYFSDFEFHSIDNQRLTTMDMKIALGPSISINRNFTVVLEPNANMQMFHDSRTQRVHSKSFYGFGFSLIRHFN